MQNKDIFCLGVMSGTSLDGLDVAYVRINSNDYTDFAIIEAITIPYNYKWMDNLRNAIRFSKDELIGLDIEYGKLLGNEIANFIEKFAIENIDFIASHGHTIFHQPDKGITLQIGNGQEIANITKQRVVCDFRTQDVKLGGQGAPLVPIGDQLLFSNYGYCINLGGFANISFKENNQRVAYDVCPVNIVLNHYCRKLNLEYDDEGKIAANGNINYELLECLNSLEFYKKKHPKSLGLEWVQSSIFPLIDEKESNVPTILRTFIEHIAIQISNILLVDSLVLVTGGGAFNKFLLQRIEVLVGKSVTVPENMLINYKEALIFAFLGVLKLKNEVNCLKSVTGAREDHSSGVIFIPEK
ncbi:Anhydro-N-acetylmuramic acid kinase [Tenacibaculum sp. 190130A14a]|uniref:Anhydro-N-acetylmuramic acid kinase n=1 Tax=Tenacibaculum polynesiense TaxID=3137857 RepID=A0ABM9PCW8_9FLAO